MVDVVEDVVEDLVDMLVTVPGGADIGWAAPEADARSTASRMRAAPEVTRNTRCYGGGMATERFSISMSAEVRDRIREHAAAAGLDVSTFLTIAAQAQMDQQDRIRRIFKPFEDARAEAEGQAGTGTWAGDAIEPTREERAEIEAILGRSSRDEAAA